MTSQDNREAEVFPPSSEHHGLVVLPCEPDQFADFIASLLGRPQVIERAFRGSFEVGLKEIESLFYLVEQRVSQNESSLVQFRYRIILDDNSSVIINSFNDLLRFNEPRPLVSIAIHISWTYLNKFPGKNSPEKQVLDVSFTSDRLNYSLSDSIEFLQNLTTPRGDVYLRISHTDRTWGADIEAMLAGQLRSFLRNESFISKIRSRYSAFVGISSSITFILIALFGTAYVTSNLPDVGMVEIKRLAGVQAGDFSQLSAQVKAILTYLVARPGSERSGYVLLSFIVFVTIGLMFGRIVYIYCENTIPSFVLLTSKTINKRNEHELNKTTSLIKACFSFVGGLTLSVLGNYMFYLLIK